MPKPIAIPISSQFRALSLLDSGFASVRYAAKNIGIPKSTLHDNLPNFRKLEEDFAGWCRSSQEREIRNTLSIVLEGKTSARDAAVIVSRLEGKHIDHHKILKNLAIAASIAEKENTKKVPLRLVINDAEVENFPLANVNCAAFDEIFQGKNPILSFIEPVSGYCFIDKAEDRSAESWGNMLKQLNILGLAPKTTNTDGGTGLLASLAKLFPKSINLRDLFHVVAKLGKALRAFEGYCYGLIAKFDKHLKQNDAQDKIDEKKNHMDRAIILFDALETESKLFRAACYCENDKGYVCASRLETIVKRIVALLDCTDRNRINHRAIKEAKTYFHRGVGTIIAYKSQLESEIKAHFGPVNALSILDNVCPMIEYLDQIQRSYENRKRRDFWTEKLTKARAAFRKFSFIDEQELDNAINKVAQIMIGLRKSNSLVESLNSVIRRFLVSFKSIPSWFCPLFTFYWNHSVLPRGKRANLKPREILTGKPFDEDWIDIILKNWPSEVQNKSHVDPAESEFKTAI